MRQPLLQTSGARRVSVTAVRRANAYVQQTMSDQEVEEAVNDQVFMEIYMHALMLDINTWMLNLFIGISFVQLDWHVVIEHGRVHRLQLHDRVHRP
jgi:hypothetical protein